MDGGKNLDTILGFAKYLNLNYYCWGSNGNFLKNYSTVTLCVSHLQGTGKCLPASRVL